MQPSILEHSRRGKNVRVHMVIPTEYIIISQVKNDSE